MRKTVIAASAAALLALSAACSTDNANVDVEGATDSVASAVDSMTASGDPEKSEASGTEDSDAGSKSENAEGDGTATTTLTLADGSEVEAPAGIAEKYEEIRANSDHLGAATGGATEVAGGQMMEFEGGTLIQNPDGQAFLVQGVILEKYMADGGPSGELGFPTTDETPNENGFVSTFENGEITFDSSTGEATVNQN